MKFVFFGYDFMVHAVEKLINEGHELLGIMSFDCDNIFNFNIKTQALAQAQGVPFTTLQVRPEHIADFVSQGCEVFLAAGYPYKIPEIKENNAYGINLHPSYLPLGRGIMPTPYILMNKPQASGITVHKITQKFDQGDILYQEKITLHENEDVETLSAKIAMRAPKILLKVMRDLKKYWAEAIPQNEDEAEHWPMPDDGFRTLNWSQTAQELNTIGRAFGRFGVIAQYGNRTFIVYDFKAWEETHDHPPGYLAHQMNKEVIIACSDGYVCLKELASV